MELKVWVEGIQRVVCGVTDSTTCQDIVYALAHATGQTGRFTLVERWRHNERLLPPQEHPLKVLAKWGEYASNVQFILRKSSNEKKSSSNPLNNSPGANNSNPNSNPTLNNKRQHDLQPLTSPISPPTTPLGQQASIHNKELKKSFTFSGSHGGGSCNSSTGSGGLSPNISNSSGGQPHLKDEPLLLTQSPESKNVAQNPSARQDIPRGVIKGIPHHRGHHHNNNNTQERTMSPTSGGSRGDSPLKTKGDRPKQPPSYDEAVSRSSRHNNSSQSLLLSQLSTTSSTIETDHNSSPSSKRRHLGHSRDSTSTMSSNSSIQQSKGQHYTNHLHHHNSNTKLVTTTDSDHNSHSNWESNAAVVSVAPILQQPQQQQDTKLNASGTIKEITRSGGPSQGTTGQGQQTKVRKNLMGQFESETTKEETSSGQQNTILEQAIGKERNEGEISIDAGSGGLVSQAVQDPQLRDLIRLVNLQREKLNSQNAELTQFDSEIVYWETKLQEQEARLSALEDELQALEKTNSEHDEELAQLEHHQPILIDAIEKGRQEDRMLRSKLSVLRAQIANCETEVLQCRQRMRHILEEIANERRRNTLEREEKERETKRQLLEIEEQLMSHKAEGEKQKTILAHLEEELKQFEDNVNHKSQEAGKLAVELREANLQSLSMAISEDIKYVAEGNFHNRSGSTRRIMGSPRQLENAVPTSKNPHGVWV